MPATFSGLSVIVLGMASSPGLQARLRTFPVWSDLRGAVRLPEGETKDEWLAKNVSDFYDQLNLLSGTVTQFCTEEICPQMTAGPGFRYLWRDDSGMEPVPVSAPKYISLVLSWVNNQIENEAIFPSMTSTFPPNFEETVRDIMKRLFRIYAHFYYHHYENFQSLNMEMWLNTSFYHFALFTKEFNLIDADQLEPLSELIDDLARSHGGTK